MKALSNREESLVKLAILEANELLMDQMFRDFHIKAKHFSSEQQYKLQEVFEVLYTTLCEIVEEKGDLQSEYDPKTII